MDHNFLERHHAVNCFNSSFIAANEDIFNGNPAGDIVNMSDWNRATFIIQKGAGATGRATLTVESCDDTTPTTATAVPFKYRSCTTGDTFSAWTQATASGFQTTAGANQVYEISVEGKDLSGSNKYARLKCTESVDDPCDGGIICILTEPRYSEDVPQTVLT